MGRSHAHAFRAAPGVFDLPVTPVLELLADIDDAVAAKAAEALGFARSTGDWRKLVADPAVDLVDITDAERAAQADRACRDRRRQAGLLREAARAECGRSQGDGRRRREGRRRRPRSASTTSRTRWWRSPARSWRAARSARSSSFRGIHAEDYMTDASAPFTWRLDPKGGHGVVADLGSHIISIARYVVGPIVSLVGQIETVTKERPVAPGAKEMREVVVDDQARALVRFASGATGSLEASWVNAGRKMQLAFEVTGSKGSIVVDHERLNELAALHRPGRRPAAKGFKTHPRRPGPRQFYREFCPAPGHQLGFNDIKTIEVRALVKALAGGPKFMPDFREA